MKPFKFFQKGTLDDPQMLDEIARATASFNADTPDGHVYRRRLYHTDRNLYDRLRNPFSNNEMERYYYDRELGRFETIRPTPSRQEELIRRINGGGQLTGTIHNDNHGNTDYVPYFTGGPRVTRVNPKWWMKIKIFFQERFWFKDPSATIAIAFGLTIFVILSLAKILNVW